MDVIIFALVLEIALLQLRVLESSSQLRKPHNLNITNKIERLNQCRLTVKEVLRRTLLELLHSGNFQNLQATVDDMKIKFEAKGTLQTQHESLKRSYNNILLQLKAHKDNHSSDLKQANKKIAHLRDKLKDEQKNADVRHVYVERTLTALEESQEVQFQTVTQSKPRLDYECRVHREMLKAFQLQIKQFEESVEHWRARYTDDTAQIYIRLAEKRDNLRETLTRREMLQKKYDDHAKEIEEWLTIKRNRAAQAEEERKLRIAATVIQAWWRGMMVRQGLGSYKSLKVVKKPQGKNKKK